MQVGCGSRQLHGTDSNGKVARIRERLSTVSRAGELENRTEVERGARMIIGGGTTRVKTAGRWVTPYLDFTPGLHLWAALRRSLDNISPSHHLCQSFPNPSKAASLCVLSSWLETISHMDNMLASGGGGSEGPFSHFESHRWQEMTQLAFDMPDTLGGAVLDVDLPSLLGTVRASELCEKSRSKDAFQSVQIPTPTSPTAIHSSSSLYRCGLS